MALEKHLRHCGCGTEVAVDLEYARRMAVQQPRVCPVTQNVHDLTLGWVALQQARPAARQPRTAPAALSAAVFDAAFEGLLGGCGKFRGGWRYLPAGEDGEHVRYVPVSDILFQVIFLPLQQSAVLADLLRRDLCPHLGDLGPQVGVLIERLGYLVECAEQCVEDLAVHGGGHAHRCGRAIRQDV